MVSPYEGEESASGDLTQRISSVTRCENDNSKKSLICYQHTGVSSRAAQDRGTQGYTLTMNWTSDKSEKSFNRFNLSEIFVTPFHSEQWNHIHEKDSTDTTVEKGKQ